MSSLNKDTEQRFDEKFAMSPELFDGKFMIPATYCKDVKAHMAAEIERAVKADRERIIEILKCMSEKPDRMTVGGIIDEIENPRKTDLEVLLTPKKEV